jgi:serine protease inhibitor
MMFEFRFLFRIVLPKFKVSSSLSLTSVLKGLGVVDAFSSDANFSRMSSTPLTVSDVLHKAVVEVDEEGTVAAAGETRAWWLLHVRDEHGGCCT